MTLFFVTLPAASRASSDSVTVSPFFSALRTERLSVIVSVRLPAATPLRVVFLRIVRAFVFEFLRAVADSVRSAFSPSVTVRPNLPVLRTE